MAPYISSFERIAMEKGMEKGSKETLQQNILEVLEIRFGDVPSEIATKVRAIEEMDRLRGLFREAVTVENLEDFLE